MKYQTTVDAVCLQIDTNDETIRDYILDGILKLLHAKNFYITEKSYPVNMHSNFYLREYHIYARNIVVASIRMGSFSMKNSTNNMVITTYYISLEFAGLKSYHDQRDSISNRALFSICAYLNTKNITFKLTGLDICIDIQTSVDNVLALCTRKSPRTNYYGATEAQIFTGTYYIEKIHNNQYDAVQRSYLYDKSLKDKLSYSLARFELKLQPKFFSKYRATLISSIIKSLDRYHVMYVPNKKEKHYLMEQYDKHPILRNRDIKRIGFDHYRCYPDVSVVVGFINRLFSIKEPNLIPPSPFA